MSQTAEGTTRTEVRDGMRITWHQPIIPPAEACS